MKLIRSFDFFSLALPMVIKSDREKLGVINVFTDSLDIKLQQETNLVVKLNHFRTCFSANENSVIMISQPIVLRVLFILSVLAALAVMLFDVKSDYVFYAITGFPILYMLTIAYYLFFARSKFLRVTKLS